MFTPYPFKKSRLSAFLRLVKPRFGLPPTVFQSKKDSAACNGAPLLRFFKAEERLKAVAPMLKASDKTAMN
jgi:hypothetical protein